MPHTNESVLCASVYLLACAGRSQSVVTDIRSGAGMGVPRKPVGRGGIWYILLLARAARVRAFRPAHPTTRFCVRLTDSRCSSTKWVFKNQVEVGVFQGQHSMSGE